MDNINDFFLTICQLRFKNNVYLPEINIAMRTSIFMGCALAGVILFGAVSCSTSLKLKSIRRGGMNASLSLPSESEIRRYGGNREEQRADDDGLYAMRTYKDTISGEVMGSEDLDAAVIVARFRNVAERKGEIDFDFMIVASDSLQDPSWQLRFFPMLYFEGGDSLALAPVYLTGKDFRSAQQRGYNLYEGYLASLSRDSTRFVDSVQADAFRQRFPSSDRDAGSHFRRPWVEKYNARKLSFRDDLQQRLIRVPLCDASVRRDSTAKGGQFVYLYHQRIASSRGMSKFFLNVKTQIHNGRDIIWSSRPSQNITYYVSSLSSLVDNELASLYEEDSLYCEGVRHLRDREWEQALELLAGYEDYNSALAYLALEYNATSGDILEKLPVKTAACHYLMAISYSRRGREEEAVEELKQAVSIEYTYKYRGNLDPEIAPVIRKYALFSEDYSTESFL